MTVIYSANLRHTLDNFKAGGYDNLGRNVMIDGTRFPECGLAMRLFPGLTEPAGAQTHPWFDYIEQAMNPAGTCVVHIYRYRVPDEFNFFNPTT